jgi:putative transposase
MNRAKVTEQEYMDFLVASPRQGTATEAERSQPRSDRPASHDAYTRLLSRVEPDSEALWAEVGQDVRPGEGVLVIDDTVIDKPHARKMELVGDHWSGKHHRVVRGINLVTVLWTDGDRHLPCDYRIYLKSADGKTKNDHFRDMLDVAKARGMTPSCVLFDGWYSSLENLNHLRKHGWHWLTRFKGNRLVNLDRQGNKPLERCAIAATGTVVYLSGYGLVKVFRIVAKDGTAEHWATDNLEMDEGERLRLADASWRIEEYHRGVKQTTNIERGQCVKARAQRGYIALALRAFAQLERWCFATGLNWLSAKWEIAREAIRAYRVNPTFRLSTA